MKSQDEQGMSEYTRKAQTLELQAGQEMLTGSGARGLELCRMADMEKINAKNYKIRMESL